MAKCELCGKHFHLAWKDAQGLHVERIVGELVSIEDPRRKGYSTSCCKINKYDPDTPVIGISVALVQCLRRLMVHYITWPLTTGDLDWVIVSVNDIEIDYSPVHGNETLDYHLPSKEGLILPAHTWSWQKKGKRRSVKNRVPKEVSSPPPSFTPRRVRRDLDD